MHKMRACMFGVLVFVAIGLNFGLPKFWCFTFLCTQACMNTKNHVAWPFLEGMPETLIFGSTKIWFSIGCPVEIWVCRHNLFLLSFCLRIKI